MTELTIEVISLTSEVDTSFLHNLISYILVEEGVNPRGREGIGESFLGYKKFHYSPEGIFIDVLTLLMYL